MRHAMMTAMTTRPAMHGAVDRAAAESLVDEPYTEPWQARAVALAVEAVRSTGSSWDDFRAELIAAIEAHPDRPYFESWVAALERFSLAATPASDEQLITERMRAASYRTAVDGSDLEVFPIEPTAEVVLSLLTDLFENHWAEIRFGPVIEGAVYELRAPHRPRLSR